MKKKVDQLEDLVKRQSELEKETNELMVKVQGFKVEMVKAVIDGGETQNLSDQVSRLQLRLDALEQAKRQVSDLIRVKQVERLNEERYAAEEELKVLDSQCYELFVRGLSILAGAVDAFEDYNQVSSKAVKLSGKYSLNLGSNKNLVSWYNLLRTDLSPFIRMFSRARPDLLEQVNFERFREVWPDVHLESPGFPTPREYFDGVYRDVNFPDNWHQTRNPILGSNPPPFTPWSK